MGSTSEGSILGSLMFIININYQLSSFRNSENFFEFGDDTRVVMLIRTGIYDRKMYQEFSRSYD